MATQRSSTLSPHTTRQSPFQRQPSNSPTPGTVRNSQAQISSNRVAGDGSPTKFALLSPEKQSPFARRPSHKVSATSPETNSSPSSAFSYDATGKFKQAPVLEQDDVKTATRPDSPTGQPVSRSMPMLLRDGDAISSKASVEILKPTSSGEDNNSSILGQKISSYNQQANLQLKPAKTPLTRTLPPNPQIHASSMKHMQNGQPGLLRSMRESFEVLDSANSGSIDSASVATMLEQMGLDNTSAALREFFPPNVPAQINLARYLDMLSSQLSDLSQMDELGAAFEAFDVDDSGQIDLTELRRAVLNVVPAPGEHLATFSERELDSVLQDFSSKRAFGAKGLNPVKTRAEVFRYRDFMSNLSGGPADTPQTDVVSA